MKGTNSVMCVFETCTKRCGSTFPDADECCRIRVRRRVEYEPPCGAALTPAYVFLCVNLATPHREEVRHRLNRLLLAIPTDRVLKVIRISLPHHGLVCQRFAVQKGKRVTRLDRHLNGSSRPHDVSMGAIGWLVVDTIWYVDDPSSPLRATPRQRSDMYHRRRLAELSKRQEEKRTVT